MSISTLVQFRYTLGMFVTLDFYIYSAHENGVCVCVYIYKHWNT